MFLRKSIFGTASMLGLAGILAFSGCSSDANTGTDTDHAHGERELGGVGLGLNLPDMSQVNAATYTITRPGTAGFVTLTGPLNISGSTASVAINGLDAGGGYVVVLTATRSFPANAPSCSGTAMFTVLANANTTVQVTLQCDDTSGDTGNVTINGTFNICPKIGSTTATPTTAAVGATVALTATATDKDAADTVSFAWNSATDGTFASASSANTTYTCVTPGTKTIGLSVTDGPQRGCTKTLVTPITITCTGAAVVDSGTPVVDSGTPVVDSGTPVVDSGTPVVDSGTPVVDSGTPVVDSGTPVVDSGTPVVDSGTGPVTSAACISCRTANCTNYFGDPSLPLIANCQDALCKSIVQCGEQSHLIVDTLTVAKPYCGNVSIDDCNVPTYVPNGPCLDLTQQGFPGQTKAQILTNFGDPTYVGGNAYYLLTCEADTCPTVCL